MKIVYLSNSVIPSRFANSIHVMKMCQAMAKLGHEVLLLAPDVKEVEPDVEDSFAYYGVQANFTIQKILWTKAPGRSMIYAYLAARMAKRQNPDLVLSRYLPGSYFTARFKIPTILELHSLPDRYNRFYQWMFHWLLKAQSFKRLVVISQALKQLYLESINLDKSKILVAHDAADTCESVEPYELGDPQKMQVGYIGHLYEGRGVEIIVEMAKTCEWAEFHLVGGLPEDIRRWSEHTSSFTNLHFHGFVPPSQTVRFRHSCDVLLAPYQRKVSLQGQGDTSGWMSPLKIFEYMEAGKAILVSDLPVLHEVLRHKETAIFCNPDQAQEWCSALIELRDNPSFRHQLGNSARQEFLRHYTWEQRAQTILA